MKALLLTAILCCTASLPAATPRANLTGTVLDANGNTLADVTVMVYHAGVKVGYSTYCPSCYLDCGKRVLTDAKGAFEIKDLAPDLWFTLLAARAGYVPQMTKSIDPIKNPIVSLKLAAKPPTTISAAPFAAASSSRTAPPSAMLSSRPTGSTSARNS